MACHITSGDSESRYATATSSSRPPLFGTMVNCSASSISDHLPGDIAVDAAHSVHAVDYD